MYRKRLCEPAHDTDKTRNASWAPMRPAMRNLLAMLCLATLPLTATAQAPHGYELFPHDDPFRSPIADPTEPRAALSRLEVRRDHRDRIRLRPAAPARSEPGRRLAALGFRLGGFGLQPRSAGRCAHEQRLPLRLSGDLAQRALLDACAPLSPELASRRRADPRRQRAAAHRAVVRDGRFSRRVGIRRVAHVRRRGPRPALEPRKLRRHRLARRLRLREQHAGALRPAPGSTSNGSSRSTGTRA